SNRGSTEPAPDWPNCYTSTVQKISVLTKRREQCSQAAANKPGSLNRHSARIAQAPHDQSRRGLLSYAYATNATVQLVAHAPGRRSPKLRTEQSLRKTQSSQLQWRRRR